jgi:hypothetical protein
MAYDVADLETGYELTGTGKHKGTSVKVAKSDVARIAGDEPELVEAELDRQFRYAHDRRTKAERTAKEKAK